MPFFKDDSDMILIQKPAKIYKPNVFEHRVFLIQESCVKHFL